MYEFEQSIIIEERSLKFVLYQKNKRLRYADFLELLKEDSTFRRFFINLLSEIPFRAYQWETPPVSHETKDQPFEFAATSNPSIDLPPDPGPFRQYFGESSSGGEIAVFDNLGNDANLIAPSPRGKDRNYSHIGVFTEEAPAKQQQALWQTVGQVTDKLISDRPIWLNTAGGGVAWLHVRIDSRPKYYRHRPYRNPEYFKNE